MSQYQNNLPTQIKPAVITEQEKQTQQHEKAIRDLTQQVSQQADTIQQLQRQIKRMSNELRLAVNTFNLRRNG